MIAFHARCDRPVSLRAGPNPLAAERGAVTQIRPKPYIGFEPLLRMTVEGRPSLLFSGLAPSVDATANEAGIFQKANELRKCDRDQ
jgi:hypothetical protein